MPSSEPSWLLFIHHFPADPGYPRVKLWRRLQRLGAVQLKNTVWALPEGDEALEDFHWLLREIEADGGEGLICRGALVAGLRAEQAEALRVARAASRNESPEPGSARGDALPDGEEGLRGRVWVTRQGVKADRIGSAWLIRRHVDADATFRFVPPEGYEPQTGEVRFDMYEAEFTHVDDACTFEVLASLFVPDDPAVAAMAEIVHDIDLKEVRYGRPETEGFRRLLLDGVCRSGVPDEARLERGFALFDALWVALSPRSLGAKER